VANSVVMGGFHTMDMVNLIGMKHQHQFQSETRLNK